jgi:hypothetical protein
MARCCQPAAVEARHKATCSRCPFGSRRTGCHCSIAQGRDNIRAPPPQLRAPSLALEAPLNFLPVAKPAISRPAIADVEARHADREREQTEYRDEVDELQDRGGGDRDWCQQA